MNKKETEKIINYLTDKETLPSKLIELVTTYLESLDMEYELAMNILSGKIKDIYHLEILRDKNGKESLVHMFRSTNDCIKIEGKTGKLGIVCKDPNYIAWLDDYKYDVWSDDYKKADKNYQFLALQPLFDHAWDVIYKKNASVVTQEKVDEAHMNFTEDIWKTIASGYKKEEVKKEEIQKDIIIKRSNQ